MAAHPPPAWTVGGYAPAPFDGEELGGMAAMPPSFVLHNHHHHHLMTLAGPVLSANPAVLHHHHAHPPPPLQPTTLPAGPQAPLQVPVAADAGDKGAKSGPDGEEVGAEDKVGPRLASSPSPTAAAAGHGGDAPATVTSEGLSVQAPTASMGISSHHHHPHQHQHHQHHQHHHQASNPPYVVSYHLHEGEVISLLMGDGQVGVIAGKNMMRCGGRSDRNYSPF